MAATGRQDRVGRKAASYRSRGNRKPCRSAPQRATVADVRRVTDRQDLVGRKAASYRSRGNRKPCRSAPPHCARHVADVRRVTDRQDRVGRKAASYDSSRIAKTWAVFSSSNP